MEKPSISFFLMNIILLFLVISLIFIVFDLHRFVFVFELMLLLIFIFLLAFAMFVIYHNKKWGWTLAGATLTVVLANTFFIFLLTKTFETAHITITFFSIIGLVVAFLNFWSGKPGKTEMEDKQIKDYYPYIDKVEPKETEQQPRMKKIFTPGKFVASKKANKFHSPKCDWAKRISSINQLWFNSEEEAKAQGFEADRCVK